MQHSQDYSGVELSTPGKEMGRGTWEFYSFVLMENKSALCEVGDCGQFTAIKPVKGRWKTCD